uniref:Uncharacterized protein n=1 Tax=Molossus molossus TaxID=27622 RepID=A0A7J8BYH7_MOLMO|nr:hypothetical protein HJG59_010052 [Molossus molossus]
MEKRIKLRASLAGVAQWIESVTYFLKNDMQYDCILSKFKTCPAAVAQWLRINPCAKRLLGSIPGRGTCPDCGPNSQWGNMQEAANQCSLSSMSLSLSLFLPLSLKINKEALASLAQLLEHWPAV